MPAERKVERERKAVRDDRDESKLFNYTVDLGSISVMAKDEDEAEEIAKELLEEGGWVNIDQILEM